jgi:hypothetical protein
MLAAVALLAIGGFAPGCGEETETKGNHQIWFMGSIYDGAMGTIIPDYAISMTFGKTTIQGTVDANGRYTLGPLPAWNDYAITISRPYYRAFVSYNAGIAPPTPPPASQQSDVYSANTTQTLDYDAYLFPESLAAAPLAISVVKTDSTTTPVEGSIRLRPTGLSSIQDQMAGITGQVWANDQDMLAAAFNGSITAGSIIVPSESLVYGVPYSVQVYGVAGYQPMTTTVRAGSQESLIVNISTTASPLVMTSNTIAQCKPYGQSTNVVATAQITFTFNAASIEDATPVTTSAGRGPELLDAGLSVTTMLAATLKPNNSTSALERGTSFLPNGNTLTISWNPSSGLTAPSASDSIISVTYNNLGSIWLQPAGHPELAKTLSSMLPAMTSFIICGN